MTVLTFGGWLLVNLACRGYDFTSEYWRSISQRLPHHAGSVHHLQVTSSKNGCSTCPNLREISTPAASWDCWPCPVEVHPESRPASQQVHLRKFRQGRNWKHATSEIGSMQTAMSFLKLLREHVCVFYRFPLTTLGHTISQESVPPFKF